MRTPRLATVDLPDFGASGPAPGAAAGAVPGARRGPAGARGRARVRPRSSSTRTASTARTSRSSPGSTRGSRRRCWSWARTTRPRSSSATSAGGRPAPRRSPMNRDPVPGLQPAGAAARPVAAAGRDPGRGGDRRREPGRGHRLEAVRRPVAHGGPRVHRRRAAALVGRGGLVENANDLMVDPRDGLRIINDVDQLAAFEHAVLAHVRRRAEPARGLRTGMTEAEAVRLLGWDGTPLSCHLMLTAGDRARFGLLSPSDRPDRARRAADHRVRDLGRPDLPRRLGGGGRAGPARGRPRLRRQAGRAVLRRRRRVVRRAPRRPARRRAPGDHRPAPGRPVLRDLPQPRPPAPPRRVGELAGLARLGGGAAVRDGDAGRHHPGHRHAVVHDQHRGRDRARRRVAAGGVRRPATPTPGRGSRRAGRSCATRWASTSTPTCCRSRTSPRPCRRSSSAPTASLTLAG